MIGQIYDLYQECVVIIEMNKNMNPKISYTTIKSYKGVNWRFFAFNIFLISLSGFRFIGNTSFNRNDID